MKIAIIGISCRLPNNINSLDDLYNVLINKIDCVKTHPKERFNIDRYYDPNNNVGKMRTKRGGYINNIYDFDAEFFKISPKEAKTMDPQQRHMLELIYECIIDSQIPLTKIKGSKTGVFIGSCSTEYFSIETEQPEYCNEYSITGGLLTLLSNRMSYVYDLKGPSFTVDTACSSSGHALHLACQSIKNGESDMCFVGGSNMLIKPETFVGFSQATMLSPDGKCKSFDAEANGYVRGEGFVSLLIKPLDKAIEDNNNIYAVINNTGINQDGKTPSITMPNPDAQMDLLRKLYKDEDLKNLLYIEAHGTGTVVGDYNESLAIGTILGKKKDNKLNIGSIKSNIGHLEASSGLSSIVKLCLMMKKKELLPNIHFNEPSPKIDFEDLNLNVVTNIIPINQDKILMGLNNFGFGGSNFHCVLENYKSNDRYKNEVIQSSNNKYHLLAIHGINENSIDSNILRWTDYNEKEFMYYLHNQNKKYPLNESKIFIIKDKDDFEDILYDNTKNNTRKIYTQFSKDKLDIGMVFCGQGPQHINMGYDMCDAYPVFKKAIINCDNIWIELTGESFVKKNKLFLPEFKDIEKSDVPINEPIVAQPAIFFYQVALVELYKSFGIKPTSIIGHSAGEQCAFYAAGALSLEDTIKISYYRSILQQKTAGTGNMLVIGKSEEDLNSIMKDTEYYELYTNLELACQNDSNSIVLSGSSDKIKELNGYLSDQKIFNVIIRGNCPFHSSLQEIIKEEVINSTKDIKFNNPEITLISSALGEPITTNNYTNDYWWKNIRQKVSFVQGMKYMDNIDIFVEMGPHPVLGNNIKNIYSDSEIFVSSNRKEDSSLTFMSTLANLWAAGNDLNLDNFGEPNNEYIPKYSWNHKTYINEPKSTYYRNHGITKPANLIEFEVDEYSYIPDHIINNNFIFPTVGYLDIILRYFGGDYTNVKLNNFEIKNMYVPKDKLIQINWEKINDKIIFKSKDNKTEYLNTNIELSNNISSYEKLDIKKLEKEYNYKISGKECYKMFQYKNFQFGKNMKSIDYALVSNEACLIKLVNKYDNNYKIHPILLDAGLLSGLILTGITNTHSYLPTDIENIEINLNGSKPVWVYSEILVMDTNRLTLYVKFYNKDLEEIISFKKYSSYNVSSYKNNSLRFMLEYEKLEVMENINNINNNKSIYGENDFNLDFSKIDDLETSVETLLYTQSLDTVDIYSIRMDILKIEKNPNIKSVYFVIKEDHNGMVQGFIRSYVNESKKNISLIILTNDQEMNQIHLNSIISNVYGYNSEYYIRKGYVDTIKLNKHSSQNIGSNAYYLNIENKGNFNSLGYYPIFEKNIPNEDVVIKVIASAINFKDVMVSLGVVSEDYIGYELSGIVIRPGNSRFKKGDEVIASPNKTGKGIANIVYCNEKYVWKKPKKLSFVEAAAVGLVFGTTYVCLIDRARIKEGDTVLIHSATGGVGQSAIQFCKMMGANIIASAGNDDKRRKLKEIYGINNVTNSRNPDDFKRDVLKFTNNKGVDVILNSLAGKSLITNLQLLKEGGIMVEIGKRDILENNSIEIGKFIDSITYSAVHFDRLMESNPDYVKEVMTKVIKLFDENILKPLEIEEHHISEAASMIKYMSKGLHTGKIVLNVDDWKPNEFKSPECIFSPNKYYIVSGGLGGLGIELINWMNNNGANNFILFSRSGKKNAKAKRIISLLEEKGCNIIIAKIDICDYDNLLNYVNKNKFEIDGVFHLAGLIKDKMIDKLTEEDINDVLKPKVKGCQILHQVTLNQDLRFFVTFSSISALVGNPGQANYAAANCYLDRFCYDRKMAGLPALSINVGAVGGTGMIQNNHVLAKSMIANGFSFIHYNNLFENMAIELFNPDISQICITNQDWNKMANALPKLSLFSKLSNNINKLKESKESVDISGIFVTHIKELLEIEDIETNINLLNYGIDSIMAMELSSWCSEEFNVNIPQLELLQGISIDEIINNYFNNTNADNNITNADNNITNADNDNDNNNTNVDDKKTMLASILNHIKELLELEENIDPNVNLLNYGIDSIMAMELANWCKEEFNITINQVDILQGTTVNKILNIQQNTNMNASSTSNKKNNKISKVKKFERKIRKYKYNVLGEKTHKIKKVNINGVDKLIEVTRYNLLTKIVNFILFVVFIFINYYYWFY